MRRRLLHHAPEQVEEFGVAFGRKLLGLIEDDHPPGAGVVSKQIIQAFGEERLVVVARVSLFLLPPLQLERAQKPGDWIGRECFPVDRDDRLGGTAPRQSVFQPCAQQRGLARPRLAHHDDEGDLIVEDEP